MKSHGRSGAEVCSFHSEQEIASDKAHLNIAASGKFSSDRTIAEYAKEIWQVKPCPTE